MINAVHSREFLNLMLVKKIEVLFPNPKYRGPKNPHSSNLAPIEINDCKRTVKTIDLAVLDQSTIVESTSDLNFEQFLDLCIMDYIWSSLSTFSFS